MESLVRRKLGITIRPDGTPLRTKVVATIGPDHHLLASLGREPPGPEKRPLGPDREPIDYADLTYATAVRWFFQHGVDVIRLNCSHVPVTEIRRVYGEIRMAIQAEERGVARRKRMAVLADLPGPKFRLRCGRSARLLPGAQLMLSLRADTFEATGYEVQVDGRPLAEVIGGGGAPGASLREFLARVQAQIQAGRPVEVLIGDGELVLEVAGVADEILACQVVATTKTFEVSTGKGCTFRGIDLDVPTFTRSDRVLIDALLEAEYEHFADEGWEPILAFVALSFAQGSNEILGLKHVMETKIGELSGRASGLRYATPDVVAKIETRRGFDNRKEILDVADAVMVARGDLGLQTAVECVPAMQKTLIRLCNQRGKPVITATQMLKSMTESLGPTRAEGSDVFNAIEDGTDAVMTSEETAGGRYPCQSLATLVKIAIEAEAYYELQGLGDEGLQHERRRERLHQFLADDARRIDSNSKRIERAYRAIAGQIRRAAPEQVEELRWRRQLYGEKVTKAKHQSRTNRITESAGAMAETPRVSALVAASTSGRTVRMLSRIRPPMPVVGATHDLLNARKLAICYGVLPVCIGPVVRDTRAEELFLLCEREIKAHEFLRGMLPSGTEVIFVCGTPAQIPGSTNLVHLREIR